MACSLQLSESFSWPTLSMIEAPQEQVVLVTVAEEEEEEEGGGGGGGEHEEKLKQTEEALNILQSSCVFPLHNISNCNNHHENEASSLTGFDFLNFQPHVTKTITVPAVGSPTAVEVPITERATQSIPALALTPALPPPPPPTLTLTNDLEPVQTVYEDKEDGGRLMTSYVFRVNQIPFLFSTEDQTETDQQQKHKHNNSTSMNGGEFQGCTTSIKHEADEDEAGKEEEGEEEEGNCNDDDGDDEILNTILDDSIDDDKLDLFCYERLEDIDSEDMNMNRAIAKPVQENGGDEMTSRTRCKKLKQSEIVTNRWWSSTTTTGMMKQDKDEGGIYIRGHLRKHQQIEDKSCKKKPSRFCHICLRRADKVSMVACHHICTGGCRKVVCRKCFKEQQWDWISAISKHSKWVCSHCRNKCPERAQCFNYGKTNNKRHVMLMKKKAAAEQQDKQVEMDMDNFFSQM